MKKIKNSGTQSRHEELTKTESGIIKMIDTLDECPSFQKIYQYTSILSAPVIKILAIIKSVPGIIG